MRTVYIPGYNHYSHRRNIQVHFFLNQSELYALQDLMSVLHVRNMSKFLRTQLFRAYRDLSLEQKQQLADVAAWRLSDDRFKTTPQ